MREIKFRAWHFREKTMIIVDELNHLSSRYDQGMLGVNGVNRTIGIQGGSHKDCIIMQHTGLRDINGNPIYEKDLLRIGKYKTLVQVVYRDGAFQTEGPGDHDHEIHRPLHYFVSNQIKMEVVGNIYQDPDF